MPQLTDRETREQFFRLGSKRVLYPRVGRTGLANMLFPWARAEIARAETGSPMLAPQWFNPLRIGPVVRWERDSRYYLQMFNNSGYIVGWLRWYALLCGKRIKEENLMSGIKKSRRRPIVVEFAGIAEGFSRFGTWRATLEERLREIIASSSSQYIVPTEKPFIGVHLRRGDIWSLSNAKRGSYEIPLAWYVKVCCLLRSEEKFREFPIKVFSDAHREELDELSRLRSLEIMPKAPAVADLISLSRSSILVGTSKSTFSLWASFLGQQPTVWAPNANFSRYGLTGENQIIVPWDCTVEDGRWRRGFRETTPD